MRFLCVEMHKPGAGNETLESMNRGVDTILLDEIQRVGLVYLQTFRHVGRRLANQHKGTESIIRMR